MINEATDSTNGAAMNVNVFTKHQVKIAKQTLKMPPAILGVMGGPGYEEAYFIIYKAPLKPRLLELIEKYGENPLALSWELEPYGWTPKELLDVIT